MDVSTILGFALLFALALIFTVIGFSLEKQGGDIYEAILKIACHVVGTVFWFILGVWYPTVEATYGFMGWVFMIVGVFVALLSTVAVWQMYAEVSMPKWKKEIRDEE